MKKRLQPAGLVLLIIVLVAIGGLAGVGMASLLGLQLAFWDAVSIVAPGVVLSVLVS